MRTLGNRPQQNARPPILSILSGRYRVCNGVQKKAKLPILLTVEGMFTYFNDSQYMNALYPISINPSKNQSPPTSYSIEMLYRESQ